MRSFIQQSKLALVGGVAVLGLGSLLTSPAAASDQAAPTLSPCTNRPNHPNLMQGDANANTVSKGMYLHTEPAAECAVADHTYAEVGDRVSMACWITNYYGNTWVYVGDSGTYGWISAANLALQSNLDDLGYRCPNNAL